MWTKVRAVGPGPGSVTTLPIVHDPVSDVTRSGPVGKGGVVSTERGGVGGEMSPARYGAPNEKMAPTQLPPNGATDWASCQMPRTRRNAGTAITCPATLAAVAGLPTAMAKGSPPGGMALAAAYPNG